eukprot:m.1639360 g.1639360  ORF g.1639360 m.1639360 type:complete len:114 (-) comp34837_c0_seq1:79-420(-)
MLPDTQHRSIELELSRVARQHSVGCRFQCISYHYYELNWIGLRRQQYEYRSADSTTMLFKAVAIQSNDTGRSFNIDDKTLYSQRSTRTHVVYEQKFQAQTRGDGVATVAAKRL